MNNFNKRFLSKCITEGTSPVENTDSVQEVKSSIVSDVVTESEESLITTTNEDSHKEGTSSSNSSESTTVAGVANIETVVNLTSNPPESTAETSDNESDSTDNTDLLTTLTTETVTLQNDSVVQVTSEGLENHTENTYTVAIGENHTDVVHTETVISDSTSENLDNHTETPKDADTLPRLMEAVGDVCEVFGTYTDTQSTGPTSEDLENQTESTVNSDITPSTLIHNDDESSTDESRVESTSESVDIEAITVTETARYILNIQCSMFIS
ncbi:unnamed protein product [Schistosoma rodhaini]|uniref:Uncharacterized protein n=1 Tax=Schistosoma rodhaini TaxID=6188 RepID=A0AA85F890_9TREM|nr:unnamed protein product [Schistosoma rodhaini]CAH8490676.1 unnamed protein product [Schistosoma rodhaini]